MYNRNSISVITPEAVDLVTLAETKTYLRVDISDDDALIDGLIEAAIEEAKEYTRRSFIDRTLKFTLDRLPERNRKDWWDGVRQAHINVLYGDSDIIELPFPRISSVTSFVTYDNSNASSTFSTDAYRLDSAGGRVILNEGYTWPTDLRDRTAIEITYVSGYGAAASDVPAPIKGAIKMHVQQMYEMRDYCVMPETCQSMLMRYRIIDGLTRNG